MPRYKNWKKELRVTSNGSAMKGNPVTTHGAGYGKRKMRKGGRGRR